MHVVAERRGGLRVTQVARLLLRIAGNLAMNRATPDEAPPASTASGDVLRLARYSRLRDREGAPPGEGVGVEDVALVGDGAAVRDETVNHAPLE